ncbi:MAG: hypothetical protein JWO36_2708 [Myxococcales bacterium]|nr:hypothetical protein [Myxococcales bacterium]
MAKQDADRARAMVRDRIKVVHTALAGCDVLVERELEVLASRGEVATCSKGCAHCCRQEIYVTRAEGEAVVEWITKQWQPAQIEALEERLRSWLAWYRTEHKQLTDGGIDRQVAFYEHGPHCPALEGDACSIYPVRPMTCRTHFVSSPPDACRQDSDPKFVRDPIATPLISIPRVTQPESLRIRSLIEQQGADFLATVHLLPEWLAHLLRVEQQPWLTAEPLFRRT